MCWGTSKDICRAGGKEPKGERKERRVKGGQGPARGGPSRRSEDLGFGLKEKAVRRGLACFNGRALLLCGQWNDGGWARTGGGKAMEVVTSGQV